MSYFIMDYRYLLCYMLYDIVSLHFTYNLLHSTDNIQYLTANQVKKKIALETFLAIVFILKRKKCKLSVQRTLFVKYGSQHGHLLTECPHHKS